MKRVKRILRKLFDTLSVVRFYFVRGHGIYLAMPLSLLNCSLLVYNFLIKKMVVRPAILDNYISFVFLFLLVFVPLAYFLGLFDYHKGMYQREQEETIKLNPIYKTMYSKLDTIIEQTKEKDEPS